ncbi:arginase family protein [Natronosporangium hydrolyticum]|uniref:Arginase family protein n=1 Tax=Natronosporangium hydrolyticum TaxID=2811111 RepID=A0A895YAD8_9ACTN|nr:arginase family protein [Natronosporangium hydrolyticum]QSB14744.1 arginase family protein [Natronosporangium hydrolyticum]
MSTLTVLDAPSNLGLRPSAAGEAPGCRQLPAALRAQGLLARLGATDAGAVTPPDYHDYGWRPGDGVRHSAEIAGYSRRLADRLGSLQGSGHVPLVLGGDCSILLGVMLALRRRGRFGLVCLDGPDFRHPGNSPHVGGAAGESLALVTGRGSPDLADIDRLAPYLRDQDVTLIGCRDDDEFRTEAEQTFHTVRAAEVATAGPAAVVRAALARLRDPALAGFWVHLDADVLDPSVMPAVDTPEPGGLNHDQLRALLTPLLAAPGWVGLDVTIYDPTRDPDGTAGVALTETLVTALGS